jgi:DNA-binding MarR family transcriptional regulator
VLHQNPLLTLLGRRGRGEVVEVLCRRPAHAWSVRDLARFADVGPMAASRAVRELSALGAVEVLRPGRDARIRLLAASPAGAWLAALAVPDLRAAVGEAFAKAYRRPPGVTRLSRWIHPDDDAASPLCPTRIAILTHRDPEAALAPAGAALDAVRRKGLAAPDVSAWSVASLEPRDAVARAILAGVALPARSGR